LTDKLVLAMQTATPSAILMDRAELPGMLATLCSYESFFGPYHPQTLCLMAQIAIASWRAGEFDHARPLLERVVNDLGCHLGRNQDLRVRAIEALRDLFIADASSGQAPCPTNIGRYSTCQVDVIYPI
jgi:hypothetical protein